MSETFAERLKRLRRDAGLTQRDVAGAVRVQQYCSRALGTCTEQAVLRTPAKVGDCAWCLP